LILSRSEIDNPPIIFYYYNVSIYVLINPEDLNVSSPIVSVDYHKCRPDTCNGGICAAIASCPLNLIIQEDKYGYPMTGPFPCKGCAKCAAACPLEAITVT
jgi:MinD superfamily P-loop ATPase